MDDKIIEFRDQHAMLLTEIRRLEQEAADDRASRQRELRSILKVVARDFLRVQVNPEVTEDQLSDWLRRLDAA
ncbi:MAG: hypothetical protein QOE92_902 [Chloroflexota bacterium]|jgi:hypothetical protein|nr:hypothetical protein [Chloroflexota bacterium]